MAEQEEIPFGNDTGDDNDDEGSDFDQNPTLFVLSGVDTSLDEIVLEDCLTRVLSSYDISSDESGDEEDDKEEFLPSIMVTLLETDYNDEKGTILFCIDRSLFLIGDDGDDGENGNRDGERESAVRKADEDVLQRIRDYVLSEEAKTGDPVWIVGDGSGSASTCTIEIVREEDVEKMTEEEAYESWLKHNQAEGGDNTNVAPDYETATTEQ
mmetsp:Transcript_25211/g.51659  ORF Transcript_25211/g.51659 Transcript_25211/m.51659 type:complete len:211 (-) Transcript_25211:212-844(-)|eukprot:CAMPEP_0201197416 /NCGR_PEP_ID=MMETSP0851-20130426/154719_1 /ASSEMBLY_ACC=CAM_ASM_000631 /TAXON_ID=183588 /ORGANISM="Pseudo-nitzschia fraudulenta, Strain WWA7" /LENGTH=210 /DNA_ID=CAMNT_0047484499 /DNA_START=143 /DNA_END=775 /DNA_ORIENTATION=+